MVAEVLEVANNVNSLSSRLGVTDVAVSEEDTAVEVEAIAFKTCNLQRCRRPWFTVKCEITQEKANSVMKRRMNFEEPMAKVTFHYLLSFGCLP